MKLISSQGLWLGLNPAISVEETGVWIICRL